MNGKLERSLPLSTAILGGLARLYCFTRKFFFPNRFLLLHWGAEKIMNCDEILLFFLIVFLFHRYTSFFHLPIELCELARKRFLTSMERLSRRLNLIHSLHLSSFGFGCFSIDNKFPPWRVCFRGDRFETDNFRQLLLRSQPKWYNFLRFFPLVFIAAQPRDQ